MDAITSLVLLITLAAVALYALYWVVRKAIRDELEASRAGKPGPEPTPDRHDPTSE
ncbi:hypothetical protein [Microbacterium sp. LMI1-1-1.1]|uniref:hypothetical protein n=1 Tax=Microbacterium sp. LMI1-1-1.1 TaxID=3135223 RepID=UPI0034667E06